METIEQQFQKFYENIKLTPAQKQDAIDKYTGVCKKLHDTYYPNTTYNGSTKLLIGSYGKHTSIRPARDVDVIFIMPKEKFDQYDDNTSNKQSQLLQDIKAILETKYPNTPIKADGKIVKIEFSETKHDVELVPGWENDDGSFTIPDSENGGSWIVQRYREEIKAIAESDAATGKTKFLIRMIKKWSDNCSANLRSFHIEQKVLSYFNAADRSGYTTGKLVREFFQYYHDTIIDSGLQSHLNTAYSRAKKACDFQANDKIDDAIEEWIKIFGSDFPKTVKAFSIERSDLLILDLQRKYPAPDEEFLDRDFGIPFAIDPQYTVKVDVMINQNGWRSNHWLLSSFKQLGYRISKRAKLVFSIVENNVPGPYQVMWKVRNYGDEARDLDKLRGEITPDEGLRQKKESTLYHGEHYVECYIIKDNKCVATGQIFVPIE
jgi:hypothetical protein